MLEYEKPLQNESQILWKIIMLIKGYWPKDHLAIWKTIRYFVILKESTTQVMDNISGSVTSTNEQQHRLCFVFNLKDKILFDLNR